MEMTRTVLPDPPAREAESGNQEDRKARKARRNPSPSRGGDGARYFLAAEDTGNDSPSLALGKEFSSEDEVLVASFQKGVAFYRVETWKARAEKKGRNMVLRKQS